MNFKELDGYEYMQLANYFREAQTHIQKGYTLTPATIDEINHHYDCLLFSSIKRMDSAGDVAGIKSLFLEHLDSPKLTQLKNIVAEHFPQHLDMFEKLLVLK